MDFLLDGLVKSIQLLLSGDAETYSAVWATLRVSGLSMAAIGAWRARRGQNLLRMDRFAYGFFFALTMALVRYLGAQGF